MFPQNCAQQNEALSPYLLDGCIRELVGVPRGKWHPSSGTMASLSQGRCWEEQGELDPQPSGQRAPNTPH